MADIADAFVDLPVHAEKGVLPVPIRAEAVTSIAPADDGCLVTVGAATFPTPLSVDEVMDLIGEAR